MRYPEAGGQFPIADTATFRRETAAVPTLRIAGWLTGGKRLLFAVAMLLPVFLILVFAGPHEWIAEDANWGDYSGGDLAARVFYEPIYSAAFLSASFFAASWALARILPPMASKKPDILFRDILVLLFAVSIVAVPYVPERTIAGLAAAVISVGGLLNSWIDSFLGSLSSGSSG